MIVKNPVILAIDKQDLNESINLCKELKDHIGLVKLGLEFFTYNGPEAVLKIKELGVPIFLDLKLFDIPNTVAKSIRSIVKLGVSIVTIHCLGGKNMMKAAIDAAEDEAKKLNIDPPLIAGVTILTSMDESDIGQIGIENNLDDQVLKLAKLAKESGLNAIVCSAKEISMIKQELGDEFKTIVPGIRPKSTSQNDQKRCMAPSDAIEKGADYLVIGRAITNADDPKLAAENIFNVNL